MQINLFLRKWRNSIHLDKIGKFVLLKTTIFKANSENVLTAPPPLFASLHYTSEVVYKTFTVFCERFVVIRCLDALRRLVVTTLYVLVES